MDNESPIPMLLSAAARWVMTVGGGWMIQHGYATSDQLPQFIGVGLSLAGLGWSLYQKMSVHKKMQKAGAL